MGWISDHGRYVDAGDAELFLVEAGNPAGHALLLLHGGLGDLHDFDAIASGLPQTLRLIALELRGHGRSSRGSAPLTYAQHERDVVQVLDALNIARTSILGFSDGGIAGYRLAANAPDRIHRLVTLGAQWRLLPGDPSIEILGGLTRQDWEALFPAAIARYEAQNAAPDFDALLKDVKALWLDQSEWGYPGELVRKIQAPTLVVRGDGDDFLSLTEAVALRAAMPTAGLLNIPFVGHSAHEEATDVFLAVVNRFLTDTKEV